MARASIDNRFRSGEMLSRGQATTVLVEALLRRGPESAHAEAKAAIDRLAAVPTEPGFVLYDIWLLRLRALLATARGDDTAHRDYRDR